MRQSENVVRVLIADDSEIAAAFLERLLEEDPYLRVVGRVRNGAELVHSPLREPAQVLVVDVLMPEVGGLSVIKQLSLEKPVVVVSSVESDSKVAEECLALGASAFFSKPGLARDTEAQRLREAIKRAGQAAPEHALRGELLFIVGSTGAIAHLETLLRALAGLPISVVVVQHLPPGRDALLVEVVRASGAQARLARQGDVLEPGVLVAPVGMHIEIDPRERVRLFHGPPVNGHLPSGEVLLRSLLPFGKRVTALMLPGLGDDGARAMAALAENGSLCLVLDPRDCEASFMPRAALAASSLVKAVRARSLGGFLRQALQDG